MITQTDFIYYNHKMYIERIRMQNKLRQIDIIQKIQISELIISQTLRQKRIYDDQLNHIKALQRQYQMINLNYQNHKAQKVLNFITSNHNTSSPTKFQTKKSFPKSRFNYSRQIQQQNKQTTSPSPTKKSKDFDYKENKQPQKPRPQQTSQATVEQETKRPQTPLKEQPDHQEKKVEPTPSKSNENNDYAKLKERFDRLEQQHKKSHQKITNLQEQMAQLQQEKEVLIPRAYKFFEGQVLVGFQDYKERLTHLIQQNFGAKIKRTKLLYRLEKDYPRNLHPFVDGHAPFVVIVKNKQEDREYHFACISQGVIHKDVREQKRGWLMSLTNGRTYSVANGKSAVLYDEMYLIFGNQQLRIDGGSSKAFSNFGISNSFYNTTGNDVRDFLGPGLPGTPREADIDSYEIFQVIF